MFEVLVGLYTGKYVLFLVVYPAVYDYFNINLTLKHTKPQNLSNDSTTPKPLIPYKGNWKQNLENLRIKYEISLIKNGLDYNVTPYNQQVNKSYF